MLSEQALLTAWVYTSLTQAAGEASGQHRARSPRLLGLEETSCPREWTFPKAAVEHDSG